jgi:hypothetical protein
MEMERFSTRKRTNQNLRHWKPGESGNPGGRPKEVKELKALAREHTPEALQELIRLATGAKREETRLGAIRELLDRGYGKPVAADSPVMQPAAQTGGSVVYVPLSMWCSCVGTNRPRPPPRVIF